MIPLWGAVTSSVEWWKRQLGSETIKKRRILLTFIDIHFVLCMKTVRDSILILIFGWPIKIFLNFCWCIVFVATDVTEIIAAGQQRLKCKPIPSRKGIRARLYKLRQLKLFYLQCSCVKKKQSVFLVKKADVDRASGFVCKMEITFAVQSVVCWEWRQRVQCYTHWSNWEFSFLAWWQHSFIRFSFIFEFDPHSIKKGWF